ncbi:MAG: ABC transporter ATP-binding protein [Phycisphaerae bacterium]|nr:ABC transporter ATP-binding protein [Phycisphaerae bacterium]
MPRALSTIWRVTEGHRVRYTMAWAALIASAAVLYAVPLVTLATLDGVLIDGGSKASHLSTQIVDWMGGPQFVRDHLWVPGVLLVIITAIAGVFTHLRTRLASGAAESVARRLRDRLYDHLQRLHCRTLDLKQSGDLLQRCTSDVETLRTFLSGQLIEIGRALVMLLAPIPLMLALDWRMTVASVVIVPLIVGFSWMYFRRMRPIFQLKEQEEGKMTTTITENLAGIRVVRAFARQEFEREKFAATSGEFRRQDMDLFKLFARFWATSDLLCFLQTIVAVGTGLWLLASDRLSIGTFFWFITAIGMFLWPVRMLGRILADLGKALVAIDRVREILDTPDEFAGEPETVPTLGTGGARIEFKHVTFGFTDATPVLNDVSFSIEPGTTLGIVGPSGSGKSTIVHLLLRLYEYSGESLRGSILIDGQELKTIPRRTMRGMIGTVMQQPFLYSKTLKENILISAAGHRNDESAMQSAAAVASVHNSIEEFPLKYETMVGERGITLSGGQRQRVAIARSLVQDPRILVLDDAFSAVDTHTEADILQSFRARDAHHTTIIVAHRLSTLMHADRIIVLDHGRITQSGTHEELLAQPGMYRTLWDIQTSLDDPDELPDGAAAVAAL